MRVALLLVIIALSGCVSEFLGPPTTTTRTVTCAVLGGDDVVLEHHGEAPAGANAAVAAWFAIMADATGSSVDRFSDRQGAPIDEEHPVEELVVLERNTVVLHILWADEAEDTMTLVAPGIIQFNRTAIQEAIAAGYDADTVVRGLLMHGMGHTLGVINMGIPRYDPHAPSNETEHHHERGGVMSQRWHRVDDLPAEADRYPESVLRDWQHAAVDPRICP